MKTVKMFGIGIVLALASTAAAAFQEQQGGAAPGPANTAPAAKDFQLAPGAASAPGGTEVRIPGLGKLGVLPKMDFGLELLYGAAERKPAVEAPRDPSEDLTIRGSMKHRF